MEKKTIGNFIAALRKAQGMTQKDLAERLHVSDKTVSRWERDEGEPDLSTLPVLAEIFGVTCDELLRGQRMRMTEPTPAAESPRGQREKKHLLERTALRFQNQSLISLGLGALGLMIAFILNFGFLRSIAGFFAGLVFVAAGLTAEGVFWNTARASVVDGDLEEEEAGAFTLRLMKILEKTVGGHLMLLGMLLPLTATGQSYAGLNFGSWLGLSILFCGLHALVWVFAVMAVEDRMEKAGRIYRSEKETTVFRYNFHLYRKTAAVTGIVLVATLIFHAFGSEMIWSTSALTKTIPFDDVESFVAYMEQDVDAYPWSSPMEVQTMPAPMDAPMADSGEEPVEVPTYFDEDGNPISEEEARIRHLYDADGNVVVTFQHRNQEVATWSYFPKEDGVGSIRVTTRQAQKLALTQHQQIGRLIWVIYPIEIAAAMTVALMKRKRV